MAKELGGISGKKVLHLQCNTGADTIMLAKMGADVTGVDLVPENIYYAKKLAEDLGVGNVDFIASDIMEFMDNHQGEYDIVFTSDGAIGWLSDLMKWGRTVSHFLKDDGFFYIHEGHPFADLFNREQMAEGTLEVEYPYFDQEPEEYDKCVQGMGGSKLDGEDLSYYSHFEGKVPLSYSLKATPR
nr:class I SAM-dependent methyltransferase [Halonatronum saccharophilum]